MFTKYTNVNVPKNYSGSRFSKPPETEMKTHRAQDASPSNTVKTSVSPYFHNTQEYLSSTDKAIETDSIVNFAIHSDDDITNIDTASPESIQEEVYEDESTSVVPSSITELSKILKNIKGDDILLLALILIFATDNGEGNPDILLILSLLLLYR